MLVAVGLATLITLVVLTIVQVRHVEHGTWPERPQFPSPRDGDEQRAEAPGFEPGMGLRPKPH
jgi:hypothetical protein